MMSEKGKKILTTLILIAVFILSLVLTVIGQRHIGPSGLGMMLAGLAGLVFLLWFYNRQYK